MGIGLHFSSCDGPLQPGQPNALRFKIIKTLASPNYLLATIKYPDATNFEGLKVLLFKGMSEEELVGMRKIDPHFLLEEPRLIARFRPDSTGVKLAKDVLVRDKVKSRLGWVQL